MRFLYYLYHFQKVNHFYNIYKLLFILVILFILYLYYLHSYKIYIYIIHSINCIHCKRFNIDSINQTIYIQTFSIKLFINFFLIFYIKPFLFYDTIIFYSTKNFFNIYY